MTLLDLANLFDMHRPSDVQLKVGNNDYNKGAVAMLEWCAKQARLAAGVPGEVGPTGDFPKGKLDKDDEGGLTIAVTHYRNVVRVDFGKPTAWLGLPPEEALAFASLIVKHAMDIKGGRH